MNIKHHITHLSLNYINQSFLVKIIIMLTKPYFSFMELVRLPYQNKTWCRSIKLSSPKLSNITAVGCILVYAAVVLLGLDYSTLPANDKAFSIICTVSFIPHTYL